MSNERKRFKISIVIPVFNEESTIEKCIQSLLNQTMWKKCDWEIIVVNDGSTDKTEEIVKKYPVKLISIPGPLGPVKARNEGFKYSTGDYIFQVDADAFYAPDYVELCMKHLLENPKVGSVYGYIHQWPSRSLFYKYCEEAKQLKQINYRPLSGWFFRRKDIERIMYTYRRNGMYDEKVYGAADVKLATELKELGYELVWEPRAKWWHRDSDSLISILKKGFRLGIGLFYRLKNPRLAIKYSSMFYYRILAILSGLFLILYSLLTGAPILSFILLILGYSSLLIIPIKEVKRKKQPISKFKHYIFYFPLFNIVRYVGVTFGFIICPLLLLINKKIAHH
jgi:glycosyltransferase involved in cell wall biosynthesis